MIDDGGPVPALPTAPPQQTGAAGPEWWRYLLAGSLPGGQGGQYLTPPQEPLGKSISGPMSEDEVLKLLQQFYDEYNAPLDFNDPFVMNILQNAQKSTTQSASNAGVFGGYSNNLAQQAYIKGAAGLQGEKSRLASNALGMLTDYTNKKRDFTYGQAKDAYQSSMDQWAAQRDKNADTWRGVGGALGGIAGGVGGFFVGGPPGVLAGAGAGYNAGQQIGGAAFNTFDGGGPPPTFNPNAWKGFG